MIWNLKETSIWAREKLRKVNIKNFELDVDVLLAKAIDRSRRFIFTYPDYQISSEDMRVFKKLIVRREKREPIHYILNSCEFWSLPFYVDCSVLIPRPETEHLVAHFLNIIDDDKNKQDSLKILDIGVGSGNISVSILKELSSAKVFAVDISEDALKVAKRNAKDHGVLNRIKFFRGDLFPEGDSFPEKFDFILSNPPYIGSKEFDSLEPEITGFEPKIALISGETGFEAYTRIISKTLLRLNYGGYLIMEIGDGQLEQVESLIDQSGGFGKVSKVFDYSGKPRTISVRKSLNG